MKARFGCSCCPSNHRGRVRFSFILDLQTLLQRARERMRSSIDHEPSIRRTMGKCDSSTSKDGAGLTADRPRTKLEEDEFGYRDFAETIAAGLVERVGSNGLVIAIHGKWRSGKTSAVNMVVDALERREKEGRTIVVRFNPWWFSEQKNLTRSFFFGELNVSIGKRLSVNVRNGLRIMARFRP